MKKYYRIFTLPFLAVLLFLLPAANTITYEVTGTLTDNSEAPVAGHPVSLFNADEELIVSDVTDGLGHFRLAYQVEVTSSDPFGRPDTPSEFKLGASYPNPFNPHTRIPFFVPQNTRATISVYNILGQEVLGTVADVNAGSHEIQVSLGGTLSQGQYILRVQGDGFSLSQSMTFVSAGIGGGDPRIRVRPGGRTSNRISGSKQTPEIQAPYRLVIAGTPVFEEQEFHVPPEHDFDAGRIILTKKQYPVDITIVGGGSISDYVITAKSYEYGTLVRLTAVADEGWGFAGWSGDVNDTEPVIYVRVHERKDLTATFFLRSFPLIITIVGQGSVREEIIPQKATDYEYGTHVRLTAEPAHGWGFTGWSGDAQGTASSITFVTLDREMGITATFYSWPRDTGTSVVAVTNPATGRVWMDRNMGAGRVATSRDDSQAYGDLYQWGRAADGHHKRNSPTTSTLSNSDQPGHGSFIMAPNEPWNWRSPSNNSLWQGVNGINNPCPSGYRLPTEAEWNTEMESWSSKDYIGGFGTPLKLPVAGNRSNSSGSLINVGSVGWYWSSTVLGGRAQSLNFHNRGAGMFTFSRAFGGSVRCIKN